MWRPVRHDTGALVADSRALGFVLNVITFCFRRDEREIAMVHHADGHHLAEKPLDRQLSHNV
jgi:hypothetical protein